MVHDFNLVGCDIRWKKRQIERVTLLEGMRTKIGGRTLRVDETKAKSTDLLESKIDEVKAGIPERRRKTRNGEVVLIFRKRWQNGSSWRKWVEIGDLERRISYWEDQDFRRSLYLRFNFYQNSLLLLCTALERNFSLFLPNSFFFYLSGSQSLFSSLHRRIILGSQDELSNYFSWKIPRIPRVYLQFIDLSDNKPDAWFIFKTRQYVK